MLPLCLCVYKLGETLLIHLFLSDSQNRSEVESIEESDATLYHSAQSSHLASSQSQQQQSIHLQNLAQAIQENEEKPLAADDATPFHTPPPKRRMRVRTQNNSSNTKLNGRTPTTRAQASPIEPRPAKVFDTKANIREEIISATLTQRNAFLIEKQDYFTPLLPKNNYIQRLTEQNSELSEEEKAKLPAFKPYQQLPKQPKGIKATLKPYQLSGLSYMVYLYKNGVNGILGDDMGLGKTLQTLSLIQYLKENYPTSGKGRMQRPFLIVCPLSVLGSWMAETEKWTDLRVVRFHGGRAERSRLKCIIAGRVDKLGNLSPQASRKRKHKDNRDSLGGEVISWDSDDDDDVEDDTGVDLVVTTYE